MTKAQPNPKTPTATHAGQAAKGAKRAATATHTDPTPAAATKAKKKAHNAVRVEG